MSILYGGNIINEWWLWLVPTSKLSRYIKTDLSQQTTWLLASSDILIHLTDYLSSGPLTISLYKTSNHSDQWLDHVSL